MSNDDKMLGRPNEKLFKKIGSNPNPFFNKISPMVP